MTMTNVDQPATMPSPGEVVMIDPDTARELLGRNTHNRPPRKMAVDSYAQDMGNGDWRWTGDPIRLAIDGTVLDGQHRLLAVIESGVTLPFLVVSGLPMEAQENIDAGVPRKFQDVLALRGEASASSLAALVRKVHDWKAGKRSFGAGGKATHAQLSRTLEAHPELRHFQKVAGNAAAAWGDMPASLIGLAWWVFDAIDREDADHFFTRLSDGQNLSSGDPIYELRKQLASMRNNVRGERSQRYMLALTIKAWNAYRRGEKVLQLKFREGGAKPEQFPEPI